MRDALAKVRGILPRSAATCLRSRIKWGMMYKKWRQLTLPPFSDESVYRQLGRFFGGLVFQYGVRAAN